MFTLRSGKSVIQNFPKTASTALAQGVALALTSGYLTVATTSSAKIAGVTNREIAATTKKIDGITADYATTSLVPVIYPADESIFEADVTGASLTAASVGLAYDTASDGLSVLASATSNKNWVCIEYISATKGLFKCNTPLNA